MPENLLAEIERLAEEDRAARIPVPAGGVLVRAAYLVLPDLGVVRRLQDIGAMLAPGDSLTVNISLHLECDAEGD